MKPLPYFFLSVAVLQALVGMGLGVFMGISGDFTLAPAHAHNNLLGWVGMAIFGLYYALLPEVGMRPLATIHFWIALAGNILMPLGIAFLLTNNGSAFSVVGSLLEIISMLLFGFVMWTSRSALARRMRMV
jgi:hypothetical protein